MQLAYNFDVSPSYPIFLLVLWGLGACMIVLAGAGLAADSRGWRRSASRRSSCITCATACARSVRRLAPIWNLLHQVGAFPFAGRVFIAPYPLIPWFAVMALGFCLGPVFARCRPTSGSACCCALGIVMTIALSRWCAS